MSLLIAFFFLALAGLVKGAIGAGAPVIAVPALIMLYDVKTAVALMLMPNLLVNIWQVWQFRSSLLSPRFAALFAVAGGLGAGVGSWLLSFLNPEILSTMVAVGVFAFVGLRVLKPDWVLSKNLAMKLAVPLGGVAGILQGATGISAPVSISFINAMRFDRSEFIATISIFFISMTMVQIPALLTLEIVDGQFLLWSLAALVPIVLGLPIGRMLIERFAKEVFDRIILGFLLALAVKLIIDVLW